MHQQEVCTNIRIKVKVDCTYIEKYGNTYLYYVFTVASTMKAQKIDVCKPTVYVVRKVLRKSTSAYKYQKGMGTKKK